MRMESKLNSEYDGGKDFQLVPDPRGRHALIHCRSELRRICLLSPDGGVNVSTESGHTYIQSIYKFCYQSVSYSYSAIIQ